MDSDCYYRDDIRKGKSALLLLMGQKAKHISFTDIISERYKRKEYIIDKIKIRKK